MSASYEIGGRPTQVLRIIIVVTPPADLPTERRDAFLAVASHCTVHNTLTWAEHTRPEAGTGFEPVSTALQAAGSPLGQPPVHEHVTRERSCGSPCRG